MDSPSPASSVPTVREAVTAYLDQQAAAQPPDKLQVIAAALAALLGPALDEPVGAITPLRLVLLGGELKGKVSPRTGRTLAASTFRRYVLAGQAFASWAATRWPPAPAAAGQVPPGPGGLGPGGHLGELIRVLRTDAGMSRADLAAQARIAEPELKLIELGRRALTRQQLGRLTAAPAMARLLEWAAREGVEMPRSLGVGTEGAGASGSAGPGGSGPGSGRGGPGSGSAPGRGSR